MSEQEDGFGFVAVFKIEGSIELHKKINATQADPKPVDIRKIESTVFMNQRPTIDECIQSVKDKLIRLDDLLKDFKKEEMEYDGRIRQSDRAITAI